MKILMLGWELPPHNSGGLGVACYHMCKALAKHGADIDFIVPYTAEHPEIDFMNVIPAIPVDAKEIVKAGAGAYDSIEYTTETGHTEVINVHDYHKIYEKSVDRIVKLGEYDIIHAYDWLTVRPAIRAKQLLGIPLIVNMHAMEYDRSGGGYGNPFVRDLEYQGMMMADRVVTVSQHTKNIVVNEYKIPADKVEVIHNSFDIDLYQRTPTENAYAYFQMMRRHGYKIVMFFGRLTIQKGLHNLLHTMKKVVEHYPKSLLVFMGTGEQDIELLELASNLGIGDHVLFIGFQRGKEWRDMFDVTDITVMPSISEPFGLTAFESAAFGVPTLISKQSGVTEVLKSALRADYWDIDEMANQIVAVLRNQDLAHQLTLDGVAEVSRLSWSDNARKFMDLYSRHAEVAA